MAANAGDRNGCGSNGHGSGNNGSNQGGWVRITGNSRQNFFQSDYSENYSNRPPSFRNSERDERRG